MSLENKIASVLSERAFDFTREALCVAEAMGIESPIEIMAFSSFHCASKLGFQGFPLEIRMVYLPGLDTEQVASFVRNNNDLCIFPQVKIGSYSLDFAAALCPAVDGEVIILGVECDGHEFHGRTKERALHDKVRDRRCLISGVQIMRFTGAEIYKNPNCCLEWIVAYFSDPLRLYGQECRRTQEGAGR